MFHVGIRDACLEEAWEHALWLPGGDGLGTGNSKGKALGKTEAVPLNELGNH